MTNAVAQPTFAVVGHPNKGKSSIVSTLTHNENIAISSRSGTTETYQYYSVSTPQGGYALVDTPGFQRPSRVLAWLQKHCQSADKRAATIKRFIEDAYCKTHFPDEVALLTPIAKGAAILYVVDGSRPFGTEYEAEMEILRWTGQPSMALINPIENSDHIAEWEQALAQFFKSVTLFNPMTADFRKQLELLNTFAFLNPDWKQALHATVDNLEQKREQQRQNSAVILAHLLDDLCHYQHCQKVITKGQATTLKATLLHQYESWMKTRESEAVQTLLKNYAHGQTRVEQAHFDLPPDLFDCEEWFAWGLNKKQLVYAATIGGAASGAVIDAAVAGQSFMLGAIGGGLLGAGGAWFGADKLVDQKVKGLPLGGYQACVGPIKNKNFPYVVLGRFLHLYRQVATLNHADRTHIRADASDFQKSVDKLPDSEKSALHKAFSRLQKQKSVDDLETVVLPLFDTL